MRKNGFTILEILVVLSLFVLIALLANQVFFSALRGTSKSDATTLVKQSGNYALSVMQRNLYNSRGITGCSSDRVTYLDADGNQTYFLCVPAAGTATDGYIASGSARLTTEDVVVTSCSVTCSPSLPETPREVSVLFELKRAIGERVEEKSTLPFQTRVVLRN